MYVRRGLELGFLCVSVASGLGGGPGAIAGSTSALASGEGGDRFDCGVGFKFAAGLWQGLGATSGAASGEGGGKRFVFGWKFPRRWAWGAEGGAWGEGRVRRRLRPGGYNERSDG